MRDAAIDTHRSPARGSGRSRAAGAPPLDDMVGEGPVSRGTPRRGGITSAAVAAQRLGGGRSAARGRAGPGLVARFYGRLPRVRPLKALTVAAFGVALVGIVANAMVFQRGHHPSPLFGLGRSVDGAPDAAGTAAALPAPPVPAPVEKTGTIPPAPAAPVEAPPPAAAPAPSPAPAHHAAARVHREDVPAPRSAAATAMAHPRPGHAAPAHAKAEPRPEKSEAGADPVAKLLAGEARPAKPEAKPGSKPDAKPAAAAASPRSAKVAAAPSLHPHHRPAATASAGKPAPEAE